MCAFIFDSGKLNSTSYGDVVFESMLEGKEIISNDEKMVVSLGDISSSRRYIDIEPYVIKDNFCTINFDNSEFNDLPYCWVIEDIDSDIALSIDKRLKNDVPGYIGLSNIDTSQTNINKQFWKNLIRDFTIEKNVITCFQNPTTTDIFKYAYLAEKLGFEIKYDVEAEYSSIENSKILQSSFIKSDNDIKHIHAKTKDVDRNLMVLNFSLCHELQVSGALIWESIKNIDKINFSEDFQNSGALIEYPFLTLYHASQGIERIQKIIIELICKKNHIKEIDKEKIIDILYSHSHTKLNDWIKNHTDLSIKPKYEKLINILMEFYNALRYVRYSDKGCEFTTTPEYKLLLKLSDQKCNDLGNKIKNTFGEYLGYLSNAYYQVVCTLCNDLNIFAYELEYNSAATLVYHHNDTTVNLYQELKKQHQAKKEVLYWILKKGKKYPKYKLADEKVLNFDTQLIERYISNLIYDNVYDFELIDTVNELYDELCTNNKEKWKNRIELIAYLFSEN